MEHRLAIKRVGLHAHVSMLLLVLVLLVVAAAHAHETPAEGHACVDVDDCPAAPTCYTAECVLDESTWHGACAYTRANVSECCLDSDECCEYAGPGQTGICDVAHTCTFACTGCMCTTDEHCDAFVSMTLCRTQGECFYPSCERGLCECLNGTGLDLDQDGVPCPDDCNDRDAGISQRLVCVRDADSDHYLNCDAVDAAIDDDDEFADPSVCSVFCVEPGATCPYGYTNFDPDRFSKPRSDRADTGVPCTAAEVPGVDLDDDDYCDCCDMDARAYPDSMYAGSTKNECGDADYDCNHITEERACCEDGMHDYTYTHPSVERRLWPEADCTPVVTGAPCGGCATVNGSAVYTAGWACETNCSAFEAQTSSVGEGACPPTCDSMCDCADAAAPPVLGRCGKAVVGCLEVRNDVFSDDERCCVAAVH